MTIGTRTAAPAAAFLTLLSAGVAQARTPYILPNAFDVQGGHVTLVGATTEDDYFTPDGALGAPAYVVTSPDGQRTDVKPAAVLKDLTVIEAPVDAPGTYRVTTGQYVSRSTTFVNVGGQWKFVRMPRPSVC